MTLTCVLRVQALTDRLNLIERNLKYGKDQLAHSLQRIADVKAIVCSIALLPTYACCRTITEFESAHPIADYHTPVATAITVARAAILGIACTDANWKSHAYDAMEAMETAEAADTTFQNWVDLWIGLLDKLHRDGCVLKAETTPVE